MKQHKHVSQTSVAIGSLSQVMTSIGLIGAAIEARICTACNWDDDDFEYFCKRTSEIPEHQQVMINNIISSELLKRVIAPPAIPVKRSTATEGQLGLPMKAAHQTDGSSIT